MIYYWRKKRPHNHIFHGYKVVILLFSITPACVWAIDRDKGAVCDRVESSYRISDFALLRINGVAL